MTDKEREFVPMPPPEPADRLQSDEHLVRLGECLLGYVADPVENIKRLTALSGELLGADLAFYYSRGAGLLSSWRASSSSEELSIEANRDGHVVYDLLREASSQPLLARRLLDGPYADSDPSVRKYSIQTLLSQAVSIDGEFVGMLCVARSTDYEPNDSHRCLFGGVASAITAEDRRRSAEQAKFDSLLLYRTIFESSPAGIMAIDQHGRLLRTNAAFQRLVGYSAEELSQKSFMDLTHPDDMSVSLEVFRGMVEGKSDGAQIEKRYIRKDQRVIWVALTTAPVRNQSGSLLYTVALAEDITTNKEVQTALRESEEKFRTAFLTSPDSININRLEDGMYVAINKGFTAVTGYTEDDVIGKTSVELEIWVDHSERIKLVEALKRDGTVSNLEGRFRRKNGDVAYGLMSAAVVDLGGVPHILSSTRDITERKHSEEQLRLSRERTEAILESMSDSYSLFDGNWHYLYANRGTATALDVPREKLPGRVLWEFFPAYLGTDTETRFREAMEGEKPAVFEAYDKQRDTWWENRCFPAPEGLAVFGRVITERKRAETELQLRNILLSTQQETAIDGILVVDEAGNIVTYNRRFVEMWDVPDSLIGRHIDEPVLQLVASRVIDTEAFLARVNYLYHHNQESSHDELALRDGRVVERYSAPMFDPQKRYLGRVWYFRDITDRERAAEGLRFHQAILEETGRIAKVGGWSFDSATGEGYWTDEVARIHDLDPSLPTNRDFGLQYYEGQSRIKIEAAVKAAVERAVPYDLELELVSAKGIHKWVRTIGHPITENGKVVRVIGSFQDITERKHATAERERLLAAIEQTEDAVVVTDPDGNIQYVNPAFERATGYHRNEAVGKKPSILKSDKQEAEVYRELWSTIASGRSWQGTFVNKRKDGTHYTGEATISPVNGPDGRVINYVAVERDITRQRLMEDRLRQAQKMETVGRLAGGVAHDFNNMLQVIISYTDMSIAALRNDPTTLNYLHEVRRAAQRSAEITGQLLAFARKQTVSPKILDLNESISHSRKMIQRMIGEDIDFVWRPGRRLWRVRIDPGQLSQILANLAVNARDAIESVGTLEVETQNIVVDRAYSEAHTGLAPGEYVLLTVTDDGPGMSEETLSHLFEPFYTTKEPGKGTGLGLATVYGIVKQNEGFISAYSEQGHGTSFKVFLPKTNERAPQDESDLPAREPHRGSEVILVVEDEAGILELARIQLGELGYRVLTASSPEEAIALAKSHHGPIDLVVTDVVMPQMYGRQLAERLDALRPGLKYLYMSGYTADVIAHRGMLESKVNFMAKPFSLDTLARKVREALDG